ncbi:MAG: hypothetical protein ACI9U2_002567 [Bradymonadia bacterium]|jgi:hypothetical protein
MQHPEPLFAALPLLSTGSLLGCTTSELIDPPTDGSVDARSRTDGGRIDAGRDAQPDGDGSVARLDATTLDAQTDALGILSLDGGAIDVGPLGDATSGDATSGDAASGDASLGDASLADAGVPGDPLDCAALAAAGHSVCDATPAHCAIVFYDGSGCADACASAGLRCVASYRDDDDDPDALGCAIHPINEAYQCGDTGHQSDYCECAPQAPQAVAFEGAEGFGVQPAARRRRRPHRR